MRRFDDVDVGEQIPTLERTLHQGDLIVYAGASGDFNPLHWDPEVAAGISPTGGIIAHGMLNMGLVSACVTRWADGPEHVLHLSASFRAACPVGASVTFGGEVLAKDDEARTATLAVWAELEDGAKVVDRRSSRAIVRLG